MKRPSEEAVEEENASSSYGGGSTHIPSLVNLLLSRIISTFDREEALDLYLALVPNTHVRDMLRQRWQLKNASPSRNLFRVKRRLVSAELTVRYLDTRELINNGGILCQTTRTHSTPIAVPPESSATLTDLALSKLQLEMQRVSTYKTVRFLIH